MFGFEKINPGWRRNTGEKIRMIVIVMTCKNNNNTVAQVLIKICPSQFESNYLIYQILRHLLFCLI